MCPTTLLSSDLLFVCSSFFWTLSSLFCYAISLLPLPCDLVASPSPLLLFCLRHLIASHSPVSKLPVSSLKVLLFVLLFRTAHPALHSPHILSCTDTCAQWLHRVLPSIYQYLHVHGHNLLSITLFWPYFRTMFESLQCREYGVAGFWKIGLKAHLKINQC